MRSLLIDKIYKISHSKIHGQKYISINEDIYEYHFPNNPIMPAAFMVECALQLSRISIWEESDYQFTLIIEDLKKFKFHKIVRPGCVIDVINQSQNNPDTINLFDNILVKSEGTVGKENRVFEGSFSCKVVPFDGLHNKEQCKSYVEFLKGHTNE